MVLIASVYLVYQQLLMLFVCWAGLYAFQLVRFGRKELAAFYAVAVLGILLHLFQSVLYLGPATFVQEFRYTVSNRMFGIPTTADLKDFYQSINVVHQGTHPLDIGALLDAIDRSLLSPGRRIVTQAGILFLGLVILRALMRSSRFDGKLVVVEDAAVSRFTYVFLGMMVWLVATNTIPLLAFPAYSANYQLSGANFLFLAIGAMAAIGFVIRENFIYRPTVQGDLRSSLKNKRWVATTAVWMAFTFGLIVFFTLLGVTYVRSARAAIAEMLGVDPHRELPEIMTSLEGQVVMTNVYPSVTSFFTRQATFGGCEIAAFPTEKFNHAFNGGFEAWNRDTTSPLGWAADSNGATIAKETTDVRQGRAAAHVNVPASTSVQIRQFVTIPRQPEAYKVTATILIKTEIRDRVRLYLRDESRNLSFYSNYHPGDGMWHVLSVNTVLPPDVIVAPYFQYGIQADAGDAIDLFMDAALVSDAPVRESPRTLQIVNNEETPDSLDLVTAAVDATPARVNPAGCHAAWIKGFPRSAVTPTYYVLFHSLYTGFTLCREKACLDRLEDYIASRYRKIFKNDLVTVFSLGDPYELSSGATR